MTGVAQVPHAVQVWYDRNLLERGLPYLVHDRFGQIRDIPMNNTNQVKFRKYGAFPVATTPLVSGVTPKGRKLSTTDITATVYQYGDYVIMDDFIMMTTLDPLVLEAGKVLGEQAGRTLDVIVRDVLNAGTNVQYADGVGGRSSVASSNKIDGTEVRIASRTLKNGYARKITAMVNSNTGYNTTPVRPSFVGIIHENTTFDLQTDSLWVPVEKYAERAERLPNEQGKIEDVRFVETGHAKVFEGAGSGSIDVYSTLIFGADAYGVTRIGGKALENIVMPLGSGGSTDPLRQRATSGWKATLTAVILQQEFIVRVEHAVSA